MCLVCRAAGALPLARTKRRNGAGNEHRAQRARLAASVAPQASHEEALAPVALGGAVALVAPGVDVPPAIVPRGARRGPQRRHPDKPPATRSRKARSRRA